MELTDSDENQVKAVPDKDIEKKQTRWASSTDVSPNCVRYQLICSIVLVDLHFSVPADPSVD